MLFYLTDVCYETLYKIRNPPFWLFSYISVQLISYIQCTCIHIPEMYHCGSNCYVCVYAYEYKIIYSSVAPYSRVCYSFTKYITDIPLFALINEWIVNRGFFDILIQYQKLTILKYWIYKLLIKLIIFHSHWAHFTSVTITDNKIHDVLRSFY